MFTAAVPVVTELVQRHWTSFRKFVSSSSVVEEVEHFAEVIFKISASGIVHKRKHLEAVIDFAAALQD